MSAPPDGDEGPSAVTDAAVGACSCLVRDMLISGSRGGKVRGLSPCGRAGSEAGTTCVIEFRSDVVVVEMCTTRKGAVAPLEKLDTLRHVV
jgi:hypothetical protein